jgi:hypothetical protein
LKDYLGRVCTESAAIPAEFATFEAALVDLRGRFDHLADAVATHAELEADKKQPLADAAAELHEAATLYETDRKKLLPNIGDVTKKYVKALPEKNDKQHNAVRCSTPLPSRSLASSSKEICSTSLSRVSRV